jgi:PAS domain-containing protein
VENLPLHIFRKDTEGRFTSPTSGLRDHGRDAHSRSFGAKRTSTCFPKICPQVPQGDTACHGDRSPFEAVEEHHRPGGENRFVEVKKTPIHDADGRVIGTQCIFWDVTARERAAERCKRRVRLPRRPGRPPRPPPAPKSEFLANMSHEIRTP